MHITIHTSTYFYILAYYIYTATTLYCLNQQRCNNHDQCSCSHGFSGSACEIRPGAVKLPLLHIILVSFNQHLFSFFFVFPFSSLLLPLLILFLLVICCSSSTAVIDECVLRLHNCDHVCIDTHDSFNCSCHLGYVLAPDGHSCNIDCGDLLLTAGSGSFQSPGWPNGYPLTNFQCEWILDLADSGTTEFTFDSSAFGIVGRPPSCTTEHIEFFDGTGVSLGKICGLSSFYGGTLPTITTTSSRARVVFTARGRQRPASRVGVKVNYISGGEPSESPHMS